MKWLNHLPEKEGIYLWKTEFLEPRLLIVRFIKEYFDHGIKCGNDFYADGRHVSRFKGRFVEISDFIKSIED